MVRINKKEETNHNYITKNRQNSKMMKNMKIKIKFNNLDNIKNKNNN